MAGTKSRSPNTYCAMASRSLSSSRGNATRSKSKDVYKRQGKCCEKECVPQNGPLCRGHRPGRDVREREPGQVGAGAGAVSYTHLDVYKRQENTRELVVQSVEQARAQVMADGSILPSNKNLSLIHI